MTGIVIPCDDRDNAVAWLREAGIKEKMDFYICYRLVPWESLARADAYKYIMFNFADPDHEMLFKLGWGGRCNS